MKRAWGFDHIMTKKTKTRASSDVGLIFTAYNLRRLINIIGIAELGAYLREALLVFFAYLPVHRPKISDSKRMSFSDNFFLIINSILQKALYLLKISVY